MIILQVGVKAFLKNKEGKYLLMKRNSEKYNNTKGSWDIVGGRINPGTRLIDNLKREIKEETQIEIDSEPKLIYVQDILHYQDTHVVRLTYIVEGQGEIVLDTSENIEYKWLSPDEIENHEDVDIYAMEIVQKGLLD